MNDEKKVSCINNGRCSKADSGEIILQKDDRPIYCTECGEELKPAGAKTRAEKLKQFAILVTIFLVVAIVPWIFVSSFFVKSSDTNAAVLHPVRPSDLQKYFIGTVHLKDNHIKTATIRIYKMEKSSSSQMIYNYTMNVNATEARFDSLGLVIINEHRLFVPDIGLLSYERTDDNKIILRSIDAYAKPYWLFEEAN